MDKNPKNNYKELLPEKEYLKNLIAGTISRFGDSIDSIAYSWMVYALTSSASLMAVTFGVNTLVSVVLQPFTAAMITNMNKKAVIVLTDIGRGLVVTITAILFLLSALEPWMIISFTALSSTLEAFRQPAGTAVYPKIISKEKYTLAMSLSGSVQRLAEVIGLALAGVVIGVLGIGGALIIDAATFFISAIILFTLKLPKHEKVIVSNPFNEFAKNTKEGFSYAITNKLALAICVSACVINAALVPLSALQAAYISDGLKFGAQALSVSGISLSLGMAAGSIVFPKLAAIYKRFTLFFCGIFTGMVAYVFLALITIIPIEAAKWAAFALVLFVFGIGIAFANTTVQISFMEKIEEKFLARVSGIMGSMCLAAMPVMSFIIAAVANFVPIVTLMLGFGIFAVAVSIVFLFIKPLRDL